MRIPCAKQHQLQTGKLIHQICYKIEALLGIQACHHAYERHFGVMRQAEFGLQVGFADGLATHVVCVEAGCKCAIG